MGQRFDALLSASKTAFMFTVSVCCMGLGAMAAYSLVVWSVVNKVSATQFFSLAILAASLWVFVSAYWRHRMLQRARQFSRGS
jgi:hypothetical protein